MIVLGLNAFHGDSAAALLRDGVLVAAVEEERFRRIKHWAGFPSQAIAWCLSEAGLRISDVDVIAINQNSRAALWRKLAHVARHRPPLTQLVDRLRNRAKRLDVMSLLQDAFPGAAIRARLETIEHHVAHLSSAFHVSPFRDAAILSVDGFGDFSSAAWGEGHGIDLSIHDRVYFPHSLGVFYQALTQFIGFPNYGDEYKVMGLAPYGEPAFLETMRDIVRADGDGRYELNLKCFRHHRERIAHQWSDSSPQFDVLFSEGLAERLGPQRLASEDLTQRHKDIARSVQARYEEIFFALLESLHARTGLTDLTLAGGCAMKSVANGKIRRRTPFCRVYVQSAAGDAGGAIGAAFAAWHGNGGGRHFVMDHAYWGPHYRPDEIAALLAARQAELEAEGCAVETLEDESDLLRRTAAAIAGGKVVGWFQGRMEWGPRALGNRSILGDPRRADMKAILNAKIKRRESFRPFAPSVLEAHVGQWFEEDDAVPFMMQVFQIREDKRGLIPAVCHVDGSGRLQTVSAAANPRYHALIETFRAETGIPMVLNTSFNENEPVVCRPEEALDCFLRTKMDVLVMGDVMVERGSQIEP